MIRPRVLWQVTTLTLREFMRTPAAVFWTYGFPLLMAVSLGLAFRSSEPAPIPVAVVQQELLAPLAGHPRLAPRHVSADEAEIGFHKGRFLVVVSGGTERPQLRIDPTRPESELARLHVERVLHPVDGDPREHFEVIEEVRPGSRYIDWLIPGLIALNLLGAGLWGVGFNLVQMRVKNILRRMMVTPMHRSEFLLAFLLSRLLLVVPEAGVILSFGVFMFGVPVSGSLLLVALLVLLGGMAFIGLGLVLASRPQSIETVSGLMNLAMLPMWMLGGSFFSSDRFPDLVQPLVRILPITHLNNALRAVINDGAGLTEIWGEALFLGAFGIVSLAIAVRWFRWT